MQGPGGGAAAAAGGADVAEMEAANRLAAQNIPGSPGGELIAQTQGQRDIQQRPAQVRGPYDAGT